jgi:methionyl-tRNA formyltransferase
MLRLFVDVCRMGEGDDPLPREAQDRSRSRYFNREQMEALKEIPGDADEATIDRYARAFWYPPYECAYLTVNGTRVSVIPGIAKDGLGALLHAGDLERLERSVRDHAGG